MESSAQSHETFPERSQNQDLQPHEPQRYGTMKRGREIDLESLYIIFNETLREVKPSDLTLNEVNIRKKLKHIEHNRTYYQKHKDELNRRSREYYQKNKKYLKEARKLKQDSDRPIDLSEYYRKKRLIQVYFNDNENVWVSDVGCQTFPERSQSQDPEDFEDSEDLE